MTEGREEGDKNRTSERKKGKQSKNGIMLCQSKHESEEEEKHYKSVKIIKELCKVKERSLTLEQTMCWLNKGNTDKQTVVQEAVL